MQHSTERILTTHTGSLPRPADLVQMVEGHDQREVRANPGFASRVKEAVAEVVRKQAAVGIDVLNDGEMSKVGHRGISYGSRPTVGSAPSLSKAQGTPAATSASVGSLSR